MDYCLKISHFQNRWISHQQKRVFSRLGCRSIIRNLSEIDNMTPLVSTDQLAQIRKGTKLTFAPKNENWRNYLPDLSGMTYYMFVVAEYPFADQNDLKSHIIHLTLDSHLGPGHDKVKVKASELLDGNWGIGH
jgi:hypothetical protein